MKTVLVQVADQTWTMQAMHLASAMARNTGNRLVLLHLMPVKNPGLLGSELGITPPSQQEHDAIGEYMAVAEDYGVEAALQPMQYESLTEALVQAAEQLDALAIFARLPERAVPFWHKFQLWNVQRQLHGFACHLYTLDRREQGDEYVPSVSLETVKH